MAQKTIVELVDDLDGTTGEDVSTVEFGLDGATFEIDLSGTNAQRLRDTLEEYVGSGRRTGGRRKQYTRPVGRDRDEIQRIREWAQKEGLEIAARGRIPKQVVEAYHAAQAAAAKTTAAASAKATAKPRKATAAVAKTGSGRRKSTSTMRS